VNSEQRIVRAVIRLGVVRQAPLDEAGQQVYVEGLADIDPYVVEAACLKLGAAVRGEFETTFPSLGLILETCRTVTRPDPTVVTALLIEAKHRGEGDEPTYFCLNCFDEPHNWRVFHCAGVGMKVPREPPAGVTPYPCARRQAHYGHTYTEKCKCANVNPNSRKARERMALSRTKKRVS
jgi:hypothetical protein